MTNKLKPSVKQALDIENDFEQDDFLLSATEASKRYRLSRPTLKLLGERNKNTPIAGFFLGNKKFYIKAETDQWFLDEAHRQQREKRAE